MRRRAAQGLLAALLAVLWAGAAVATPPNVILKAVYSEPTDRYAHGILGDALEWGALVLTVDQCADCETRQIRKFTLRLPENRVFEDLEPRIVRDAFGMTYVMVVETDLELGARLALYTANGPTHATPFIGRSNRWLAPVGVADLDGDGVPEIAYVEKPHLSRELKIWRFHEDRLEYLTALSGLTNHRIGEDFISGGIRDCGQGPEMITANANWSAIMATRFDGSRLTTRRIADFQGRAGFAAALDCKF